MNTLNRRINEKVKDKFPELNIEIRINERNIATVSGECETWEQLIDVGHFVAEDAKIKNVVSEMTVKGLTITPQDYASMAKEGRKKVSFKKQMSSSSVQVLSVVELLESYQNMIFIVLL